MFAKLRSKIAQAALCVALIRFLKTDAEKPRIIRIFVIWAVWALIVILGYFILS